MAKVMRNLIFGVVVALVAGFAFANAISTASNSTVRSKITIMAPAAPGGGWDGFARTAQQTLRGDSIVANAQVVNVPGASGTIGLSQCVQMEGHADYLMVTGGVMVGGIAVSKPNETLADVTPIARVADDYAAIVVPADSEIQDLDDFIEAWKADPTGFSFAGGSLGSIEHLVTAMLAGEVGINPADVNYIAYSGGGDALSAMLSHTTTAGASGYNEVAAQVEAGELRLIAISAPEPVEGVDAPTLVEAGYNVEMTNWRGFVAPPGITDEEQQELVDIVTEMRDSPEWQEALVRNSWTDTFLTGPEFEEFIDQQQQEVNAIVEELGL